MIPRSPEGAQFRPAPAMDWRVAYRDLVTDPRELLDLLGLPALAERLPADCSDFPLRVPRGFVARMRHGNPHDPLLRQVLPLDDEYRPVAGFAADPVGDLASRGARGVLHKYHGRALLVATGSCAVHCRYCFRRHFPYGDDIAAANGWGQAVDYIRADRSIDELILSGGDPLSLSTRKLAELTDLLPSLPQVRRLRIHTRLPVVLPERVDAELVEWLAGIAMPKVVVLHVNHANELDGTVAAAAARLRSTGAVLLNQAVLLAGVNDSEQAQADLSERLLELQVMPYYLHQLDRVAGAAHFEVADETALALHERLRARLPGYLVPKLVREVAGESGKSPLGLAAAR